MHIYAHIKLSTYTCIFMEIYHIQTLIEYIYKKQKMMSIETNMRHNNR